MTRPQQLTAYVLAGLTLAVIVVAACSGWIVEWLKRIFNQTA